MQHYHRTSIPEAKQLILERALIMTIISNVLHRYDKNLVLEAMEQVNPRKVVLQFPEGLTTGPFFDDVITTFETFWPTVEIYIAGNPSYGACDLALEEAVLHQADLLIHFGHSLFRSGKRKWPLVVTMRHGSNRINVLHVPIRISINAHDVVNRVANVLKSKNWEKVGLLTTVQHVHQLQEVKESLVQLGFDAIIPNSGQVLGCDVHLATSVALKVDGFLCIAGGMFHAKGIALGTGGKPTIVIDPYTLTIHEFTDADFQRFLRQRWASIEKAKTAQKWGVVSSTKQGQMNLVQARLAIKWLKEEGKDVYHVVVNDFTPHIALNFTHIEAWVNTACPRLNIDDAPRFHVPLLDINELAVLLGKKSWEEHLERTYIPWRNL